MLEYPERFFKLNYKTGVKTIIDKLENEREEYLHKEWLFDKANLKDEYRYDFGAYKALRTVKKKLTEEQKEEAKKRIDENTTRIMNKLKVVK